MSFYQSLVSIDNKTINCHYLIKSTLQVFYSSNLEFRENDSLSASVSVKPEETFEIKLYLSNSPKFLRIDPSNLYSVQRNPISHIIQLNRAKEAKVVSFNPNTYLHKSSDLHLENIDNETFMVCGLDAWYIFENPFVGSDICIKFTSKIIMGISE
jgi:hypothetical protein